MWAMFEAGGPVMWPLLACSIVALTIVIERIAFWVRYDLDRDKESIETLLETFRLTGGLPTHAQAPERPGAVVRMLVSGIAHTEFSSTKAMEAVAIGEVKRMRRGMKLLDTIITVAPMLGILGTVTGIITAFDMLGQTGVVEDPKTVVAGIAEALITTAAGLIVSVSVVFPYNYYNARIDDAQDAFDLYGTRLEILEQKRRPGDFVDARATVTPEGSLAERAL